MDLFTAFFIKVWRLEQSLPPSLHGLHSSQCLTPCYTPFFKVNCIYLGNYFKIINLCACRCQCLQVSPLENLLPDCILQPASILLTINDTVSLETRVFSFLGPNAEATPPRDSGGESANLKCVVVSLHACINLTW